MITEAGNSVGRGTGPAGFHLIPSWLTTDSVSLFSSFSLRPVSLHLPRRQPLCTGSSRYFPSRAFHSLALYPFQPSLLAPLSLLPLPLPRAIRFIDSERNNCINFACHARVGLRLSGNLNRLASLFRGKWKPAAMNGSSG